jgi:hypothetical protein
VIDLGLQRQTQLDIGSCRLLRRFQIESHLTTQTPKLVIQRHLWLIDQACPRQQLR